MTLAIVSLLPSLLDTNGDAQNAAVLAARARWAGLDAEVVRVEHPTDLPERIDAVVVGSGDDSHLRETRERLLPFLDLLRRLGTEGVPILAVGTGWELLSWGVDLGDGVVEGLGILPGRAVPREGRVTGDLVVQASRRRLLVGFENHARDYVGAEASPLGRVRAGVGNGRDSGQEGVVMGDVFGTHLHGPVLAKNPWLADELLTRACERAGLVYSPGPEAATVDGYADAARTAVLRAAGVAADQPS